jgi:hypothetical protein
MPKRAYPIAVALAALTLYLAPASRTQAQSSHDKLAAPYLAGKFELGLGGSVTSSVEQGNTTSSRDQDLKVSFGLGAQYLYPLHDYFSLGGMLDFQAWRSTGGGNGGRNFVFDLAVLPQGKYVILPGQLEVNFSIPLGLALDALNEVNASNNLFVSASGAAVGGQVEGNTALGFVIGALLGARYQVADDFGLLLELGYLHRSVKHTVSTSVGGALAAVNTDVDVSMSWGQFALNLGAYF